MCGSAARWILNPLGEFTASKQSKAQKRELAKQKADEERIQRERTAAGANVDSSFAGFNPAFFDALEQNARNYYQGELGRQYDNARQDLTRRIAGGTLTNTSAAARLYKQLAEENLGMQQKFNQQAINDRRAQEQNVLSQKAGLHERVSSGGDLAETIRAAGETASRLTAPPQFSVARDLFGNILSGIGATIRDNPSWFQNSSQVAFPTGGSRETTY